jgi:hypothetical protein
MDSFPIESGRFALLDRPEQKGEEGEVGEAVPR